MTPTDERRGDLKAPVVVAIDGPSGVGKSSVARRVAADLGFAHLDSGALYRAVALAALEQEVEPTDAEAVASLAATLEPTLEAEGRIRLGERDVTSEIRAPEVAAAVSRVAEVEAVRARMVERQRRFAAREGRIVAEGRDMGTVVFPDAEIKVYLDADPRVRARRRLLQTRPGSARGTPEDLEAMAAVEAALAARDARDRGRRVAPLRRAPDAWVLDTTSMTLDEVVDAVRSHVRSRIPVASPEEP